MAEGETKETSEVQIDLAQAKDALEELLLELQSEQVARAGWREMLTTIAYQVISKVKQAKKRIRGLSGVLKELMPIITEAQCQVIRKYGFPPNEEGRQHARPPLAKCAWCAAGR